MREVDHILRGAAKRVERELEVAMQTAWATGYLVRVEARKFPRRASDLLRRRQAAPAQTWQSMKAVARMWTAAFGGDNPA